METVALNKVLGAWTLLDTFHTPWYPQNLVLRLRGVMRGMMALDLRAELVGENE